MSRLEPANIERAGKTWDERNEIVLDGERFVFDAHGSEVLREILSALQRGESVEISKSADLLSTQEAAELLGISRPSLVKLLDQGAIPFIRPGSHRRVRRDDVQAFMEAVGERRQQALGDFRATHCAVDDAVEGLIQTREA